MNIGKMERFVLVVICAYLVLCPFFVFPSGVPQPSDILVALAGGIFLIGANVRWILKIEIFKYAFRILFLVTLINLIYWFIYYAFHGIENRMYIVPFYYFFNMLFMLLIAYIQLSRNNQTNVNIISAFVIISLTIQFFLAFFGVQGWNRDAEALGRPSLFFNNPNQLGYYALSMITFFFILRSKYRKNIFLLLFVVFISSYLVLYSGSRAALGGIMLLAAYVIYREGFRFNILSMFLFLASFIFIPLLLQTAFFDENIRSITARNERTTAGGRVSEFQIRGYDRIYLNPQYIFYGAGEGKNDRFESYHKLEIHSAFGTMLFSYGFIGFFMFLHFIFLSVKGNFFHSILLLLPILVYNFTHNGLRDSLFWAILISIYVDNFRNRSYSKVN